MERSFQTVAPRRPRWNARQCRWTMRIVCLHWARSSRNKNFSTISTAAAATPSSGRASRRFTKSHLLSPRPSLSDSIPDWRGSSRRLAALRDLGSPYRRCGSQPELPSDRLMSLWPAADYGRMGLGPGSAITGREQVQQIAASLQHTPHCQGTAARRHLLGHRVRLGRRDGKRSRRHATA